MLLHQQVPQVSSFSTLAIRETPDHPSLPPDPCSAPEESRDLRDLKVELEWRLRDPLGQPDLQVRLVRALLDRLEQPEPPPLSRDLLEQLDQRAELELQDQTELMVRLVQPEQLAPLAELDLLAQQG